MKTALKILAIILFASCSNPIETASLKMSFVYPDIFKTKAEGEYARNLRPVIAVMETDKGLYTFALEAVNGGSNTTLEIEQGEYRIISVDLYDSEGKKTHEVHKGAPEQSNMITSWIVDCDGPDCVDTYDIKGNVKLIWQVWPVKN